MGCLLQAKRLRRAQLYWNNGIHERAPFRHLLAPWCTRTCHLDEGDGFLPKAWANTRSQVEKAHVSPLLPDRTSSASHCMKGSELTAWTLRKEQDSTAHHEARLGQDPGHRRQYDSQDGPRQRTTTTRSSRPSQKSIWRYGSPTPGQSAVPITKSLGVVAVYRYSKCMAKNI